MTFCFYLTISKKCLGKLWTNCYRAASRICSFEGKGTGFHPLFAEPWELPTGLKDMQTKLSIRVTFWRERPNYRYIFQKEMRAFSYPFSFWTMPLPEHGNSVPGSLCKHILPLAGERVTFSLSAPVHARGTAGFMLINWMQVWSFLNKCLASSGRWHIKEKKYEFIIIIPKAKQDSVIS